MNKELDEIMDSEDQNPQEEVNTKEVLDSVKVEVKEGDIDETKPELGNEEEINKLYDEFSSFVKNTVQIEPDTGEKTSIPTGLQLLDAILGGGFTLGSLSIIVGQPGSGKSMLAAQVLGNAQKETKGQMLGGYLDSEESTTTIRLSNLGVRAPKIKPYNDVTVEKVFKFIEGLCLFKETKKILEVPSVIVWDSIANTLSEKEREAEDPNSVIGYKARLLSILVPKYVSKLEKHNISLIAVNQLRDKLQMGPYSAPADLKFMSFQKDMPGGNVLKFNSFHLIEMKIKKALEPDKYGFEGILVEVKCVKNKLFTPNLSINLVGSFTNGFSNFWTNYNFLVEQKRLNSGAWNYLVDLPDKKFRTKDAYSNYKEDESFRNAFNKAIEDTIQTEIIDKYAPTDD